MRSLLPSPIERDPIERGPFELSGPSQPPLSGGRPRQLVVLLHGYGSDGNDLIGLAPHWARELPDAEFVSPHAPFPCEMSPMGRQWFSFEDRSPVTLLAGGRAAAAILDAYLDETLAARKLTDRDMALVGFSQGAMMSLFVGLRRARQLAGIIGFSGMLPAPDALKDEIKSRPPVLLIHGDADEMLPSGLSEYAAQVLQQNGVEVALHVAQGLGHGIDQTGLSYAASFLLQVLKLPMPT